MTLKEQIDIIIGNWEREEAENERFMPVRTDLPKKIMSVGNCTEDSWIKRCFEQSNVPKELFKFGNNFSK